MGYKYTVIFTQANSDDAVAKQTFDDYDMALEFAETWACNGLTYTIVERFE